MASVTSLDKDLRKMRLDKYTPQACREIREWVQEILGKELQSGDLLEVLRDGLVLCSLINKAGSSVLKAKPSNMPFVQRENISLFVRACQNPPFSLPDHDIFLTDDLYEAKDPAQVLQCITAFSRRANAVKPAVFPRPIGAQRKTNMISPQQSGVSQNSHFRPPISVPNPERGNSNARDSQATPWNPLAKSSYVKGVSPIAGSGSKSPPSHVSSWSKKPDEGQTTPAWNIHQYGYTGGASQGKQGIAFGARRQITAASPLVPSFAEKEQRRKEEAEKAERQRVQGEEAERRIQLELEAAEEERARAEQESRWQEETRRQEESERAAAEAEERKSMQEQRRLEKEMHEQRHGKKQEWEPQVMTRSDDRRQMADDRLQGQFLSQYQAKGTDRAPNELNGSSLRATSESERIKDLEEQLAKAKERELQYQQRHEERLENQQSWSPETAREPERPMIAKKNHLQAKEQEDPADQWENHDGFGRRLQPERPDTQTTTHTKAELRTQSEMRHNNGHADRPRRPLPDPSAYTPTMNRTDEYLSQNPAPSVAQPESHRPADYSTSTEVDVEKQRRVQSQAKTKAGGWASKSLLEREMERERERQREWEEGQKQTAHATRDQQEGTGTGQSWDVHQYGYTGGDSQNRGGPGLGVGGARRQILGPRPQR